MSAKEMFEELGYELYLQEEETLIYRCKKDYVDNSVTFHLGTTFPKTYDVSYVDWWNNDLGSLVPMNEREDEWLKHSCKYGHWQKVDRGINIELHKAINQQCKELGWINE